MSRRLLPSALIALSAVACSSASLADGSSSSPTGAAPAAGDFHYQKTLTASAKLEVYDQNGPIHVEPASGDTLEIVAIKTGRREDFGRVQVVVREDGGTIVACALWPGQDPSTCRAGSAPSGENDDHTKVRVELRVRVPAKIATLSAQTMNGSIDAESPAGDVKLRTMNGAIDVRAHGAIAAQTMNGKLQVSLAASTDADVHASTMNGHVTSELGSVPAPAMPRMHDVKLRLGAGGTPISLRTMNGDVVIRRDAGSL